MGGAAWLDRAGANVGDAALREEEEASVDYGADSGGDGEEQCWRPPSVA